MAKTNEPFDSYDEFEENGRTVRQYHFTPTFVQAEPTEEPVVEEKPVEADTKPRGRKKKVEAPIDIVEDVKPVE